MALTKLETFTSHNVTIIDRTNIPVSLTNQVIELQRMVSGMVKRIKKVEKSDQRIEADKQVKFLADWMRDSVQWDAENAIREMAKARW